MISNNKIDVDIKCQRITGISKYGSGIEATIEDFDLDDLFENWDGSDLVSIIGKEKILNAIGREDVISYFGLED